jgi:hypothetical protein
MRTLPELLNKICMSGGSHLAEVCYTFQYPPGSEITNIPNRITHTLILIIFLISAGLRLGMVVFNRKSNDDHFTVIQLILNTKRLPEKADCWECYQPKLFHYTAAKFLQLTGLENTNPSSMILAVEMLNYTAGLITILVIRLFLYRLPDKNGLLKVIAFGLVALNPGLIGINSQATNDTFAILFSTLALFCTYSFLQKKKVGYPSADATFYQPGDLLKDQRLDHCDCNPAGAGCQSLDGKTVQIPNAALRRVVRAVHPDHFDS